MNKIRIALVQMQAKVGDCAANAGTMKRFMCEAAEAGVQLVCFPETSLTGYDAKRAEELAVASSCEEVHMVFDDADELGIAVCFGFFELGEGGEVFIAQPLHVQGKTLWHRKTHLGAGERATVMPGDELETIDVFGVRVGVQVCWETHFPELSTIQRAQGAEVVLMPFASGASGDVRRDTWTKYLPARASDNGMYVLACNALHDPDVVKSPTALGGGLLAVDPHGEVMDGFFDLEEHMLICNLTGELPREANDSAMGNQSYFDARRPEVFERYL